MEIRLLEYFIKLSEELHFTRAAELLGITQPTLSQQIQLLESRLDTKLFERSGKKINLTQSGKILRDHALRIFYELDQAIIEIQQLHVLRRRSLNVGCAGTHMLIQPAIAFQEKYPDIELSITDLRSEETIEALLNHKLDLGIIFLPTTDPRLECIHLYEEEFCLVLSNGHSLARTKSVTLEELRSTPLALLPKRYLIRQFIDEYTNPRGFKLTPTLQLSSLESLRQILTYHELGSILTHSYLKQISDPNLVAVPIVNFPRMSVSLVYPQNTPLDSVSKLFIQSVLDIYRPHHATAKEIQEPHCDSTRPD
ncbi:LysR family transcriptional regulator [Alicyclobacillus dauci]|uniref:LysR substrate-binding domain-containing protein n=1 Tax=Alicyclobacillus dauci TaxID=1475485 RepID=A0ABY6YYQ3_9BACL|nr:LysR substrate-binding domain-containing protein [Alicyclobacillus dauci]WAH35717.1 LysR substrate-binding domain-containing protein [Alicyclobacillus dauci]